MKKIVLLIDTLNAGGAQRQIINLAIQLKNTYQVSVMYYYHSNHFITELETNNIPYYFIKWETQYDRIIRLRRQIKLISPDAVISFLDIPSIIALITTSPWEKRKLIVSERTSRNSFQKLLLRMFYFRCNYVIANSIKNSELIKNTNPFIKNKIVTIYNSVDHNIFYPRIDHDYSENKLLIVASFKVDKNPINFIKAISYVLSKGISVFINWYGHKNTNIHGKSKLYDESIKLIHEYHLENHIIIKDPTNNIGEVYRQHSALILPSIVEGLPNVVCEAMACGLPILMSNISDAKNLVERNGFLFDPNNVESIAKTIITYIKLSPQEKREMGEKSYLLSKELFSTFLFKKKYIELIENE